MIFKYFLCIWLLQVLSYQLLTEGWLPLGRISFWCANQNGPFSSGGRGALFHVNKDRLPRRHQAVADTHTSLHGTDEGPALNRLVVATRFAALLRHHGAHLSDLISINSSLLCQKEMLSGIESEEVDVPLGLFAKARIKKHTVLITLYREHLINHGVIPNSVNKPRDDLAPRYNQNIFNEMKTVVQSIPAHRNDLALMVYLYYLRFRGLLKQDSVNETPNNNESKVQHLTSTYRRDIIRGYVDSLPATYSNPIFWRRSELAALQHPISIAVVHQLRMLQTVFRTVAEAAGWPWNNSDMMHEEVRKLMWAASTTSSRSFSTRCGGTFLPILDLVNHNRDSNAMISHKVDTFGKEGRSLQEGPIQKHSPSPLLEVKLIATRSIPAGEEITINYGNMGDDVMLMNFGFIDASENNRLHIHFSVDKLRQAAVNANVSTSVFDDAHKRRSMLRQLNLLRLVPSEALQSDVDKRNDLKYVAQQSMKIYDDGWLKPFVSIGGPEGVDRRLLAAARVALDSNRTRTTLTSLGNLTRWDSPTYQDDFNLTSDVTRLLEEVARTTFAEHFPQDANNTIQSIENDINAIKARGVFSKSGPANGGGAGVQFAPLTQAHHLAIQFRLNMKAAVIRAIGGLRLMRGGPQLHKDIDVKWISALFH
eukprot:GHVN01034047.1.p1 GENE.GHVN01034047.1~~GHVN01034047.1.p1  ORF type:complete len:650 (-),score=71.24 GHVN01034047.1:1854-3803(-)